MNKPALSNGWAHWRAGPVQRLAWIVWSLKIHDAPGAASITQKSTNPKCGGLEWQGLFPWLFSQGWSYSHDSSWSTYGFLGGDTLKSYTWDSTQSSLIALGEERFLELGLTVGPWGKKSGVRVHICHWTRLRLRPQHFILGKKEGWNFKVDRGIFWRWRFFGVLESPINTVKQTTDLPTHKLSEALQISAPTPSPPAVLLV